MMKSAPGVALPSHPSENDRSASLTAGSAVCENDSAPEMHEIGRSGHGATCFSATSPVAKTGA
jgi:hypothetical protein